MGGCISGLSVEIPGGEYKGQCVVETVSYADYAYEGLRHDAHGVLLSGDYAGHQFSRCDSNGLVDFQQVGPGVSFSPAELAALEARLERPAGTNTIMLNAQTSQPGSICVSMGQKPIIDALIGLMQDEDSCSALFSEDAPTKCAAILKTVKDRYPVAFPGHKAPQTTPEWFAEHATALTFGVLSLLGVVVAFGVGVPWFQKWFGPRGGGGHGGGPFAGGGGGGRVEDPATAASEAETPAAAEGAARVALDPTLAQAHSFLSDPDFQADVMRPAAATRYGAFSVVGAPGASLISGVPAIVLSMGPMVMPGLAPAMPVAVPRAVPVVP